MSLISKIKVNYLEKKVKAAAVNSNKVRVTGTWTTHYDWLAIDNDDPLGSVLDTICGMLDVTATIVEGKKVSTSFYAVSARTSSSITYSSDAETPSTSKIYVDVNDGNKLYKYDGSAYVALLS